MKYKVEPIMGMGRAFGYYLWANEGTDGEELIGKFEKRKWAETMKKFLDKSASTPETT